MRGRHLRGRHLRGRQALHRRSQWRVLEEQHPPATAGCGSLPARAWSAPPQSRPRSGTAQSRRPGGRAGGSRMLWPSTAALPSLLEHYVWAAKRNPLSSLTAINEQCPVNTPARRRAGHLGNPAAVNEDIGGAQVTVDDWGFVAVECVHPLGHAPQLQGGRAGSGGAGRCKRRQAGATGIPAGNSRWRQPACWRAFARGWAAWAQMAGWLSQRPQGLQLTSARRRTQVSWRCASAFPPAAARSRSQSEPCVHSSGAWGARSQHGGSLQSRWFLQGGMSGRQRARTPPPAHPGWSAPRLAPH